MLCTLNTFCNCGSLHVCMDNIDTDTSFTQCKTPPPPDWFGGAV